MTEVYLLRQKLRSPGGLCTSVCRSDEENAERIEVILSAWKAGLSLERSLRSEPLWLRLEGVPLDFGDWKYRIRPDGIDLLDKDAAATAVKIMLSRSKGIPPDVLDNWESLAVLSATTTADASLCDPLLNIRVAVGHDNYLVRLDPLGNWSWFLQRGDF